MYAHVCPLLITIPWIALFFTKIMIDRLLRYNLAYLYGHVRTCIYLYGHVHIGEIYHYYCQKKLLYRDQILHVATMESYSGVYRARTQSELSYWITGAEDPLVHQFSSIWQGQEMRGNTPAVTLFGNAATCAMVIAESNRQEWLLLQFLQL